MANVLKLFKQALFFPILFIKGRMQNSQNNTDKITNDSGMIVDMKGKKVAVYKDTQGGVKQMSAVCTHLGCIVDWNNTEKTWDCPCHGSRYDKLGKVINGPASKDLPAF